MDVNSVFFMQTPVSGHAMLSGHTELLGHYMLSRHPILLSVHPMLSGHPIIQRAERADSLGMARGLG